MRASRRGSDPDRHRRQAVMGRSAVIGVAFGVIGAPLSGLLGLPPAWHIVTAPLFGLVVAFVMYRFLWGFTEGAGHFLGAFVQPSGDSTPYQKSYSDHDALAVRGDVAEALAAYEATLLSEPGSIVAHRQAAELHLRQGDPARAVQLFMAMRRLPLATRADELYATQRLVDLHLGASGDAGKALVELRRLSERFAGTREAEGAREAIRRLKEGRGAPPA